MQLRGDQLFRKRLAGIDVIRVLDVEGELHRRGVSGRNNYVVGGNKIDKDARLGSCLVPASELPALANQRAAQQAHTHNKQN